jgi:hypothetical protein
MTGVPLTDRVGVRSMHRSNALNHGPADPGTNASSASPTRTRMTSARSPTRRAYVAVNVAQKREVVVRSGFVAIREREDRAIISELSTVNQSRCHRGNANCDRLARGREPRVIGCGSVAAGGPPSDPGREPAQWPRRALRPSKAEPQPRTQKQDDDRCDEHLANDTDGRLVARRAVRITRGCRSREHQRGCHEGERQHHSDQVSPEHRLRQRYSAALSPGHVSSQSGRGALLAWRLTSQP